MLNEFEISSQYSHYIEENLEKITMKLRSHNLNDLQTNQDDNFHNLDFQNFVSKPLNKALSIFDDTSEHEFSFELS